MNGKINISHFTLDACLKTFSFSENAYILYTDAYTNVTLSVNQIQLLDGTVFTAIFMGL